MSGDETVDLVARFGTADTVVVTDNLNRELAVRSDPESLAALWAALGDLGDGWHVPDGGVPIARLRFNFRRDGAPIGNLSVQARFLTAHVDGTFLARDSDADTRDRLLDALEAWDLLDEG